MGFEQLNKNAITTEENEFEPDLDNAEFSPEQLEMIQILYKKESEIFRNFLIDSESGEFGDIVGGNVLPADKLMELANEVVREEKICGGGGPTAMRVLVAFLLLTISSQIVPSEYKCLGVSAAVAQEDSLVSSLYSPPADDTKSVEKKERSLPENEIKLLEERDVMVQELSDAINQFDINLDISFSSSEEEKKYIEQLFELYGTGNNDVEDFVGKVYSDYFELAKSFKDLQENNASCQVGSNHRSDSMERHNQELEQLLNNFINELEQLSVSDDSSREKIFADIFAKKLTVDFFKQLNEQNDDILTELNNNGINGDKNNRAVEVSRFAFRDLYSDLKKQLNNLQHSGADEIEIVEAIESVKREILDSIHNNDKIKSLLNIETTTL